MRTFFRKLRWLTQRDRKEVELREELQFHLEEEAAERHAQGVAEEDASWAARRELGNLALVAEDTRAMWGWTLLEQLAQDLRFSGRLLRKSPGFTFTAAATLALGIGATTVVFSVLNAFILRPLDVPDADSLYQIERGPDKAGSQSYPDYVDLRDRNRTFEDLAAFSVAQVGLDTGDNPTRAWAESVTGNYFDALRIQPHMGRFFHASDEHGPNSVPDVVLGHSYWHTHF